uniref:Uncharacterized protein n=1 Tax=Prevotella sp. GTC17253 TaxID=3236793 RepID=A0AB33IZ14_9BACT
MFVVRYEGKFGFIKPWTSVRDGMTYTQQFLTPSIIEGIEKKLFPEMLAIQGVISKILRYKLRYDAVDIQKEKTQARGWEYKKKEKLMIRNQSVLERGVMINPILYLGFDTEDSANRASKQHICLCRNEDLMFPMSEVVYMSEEEFNQIEGFELRFGESEQSFLVGYNRFANNAPMYGWLEISGNPVSGIK